MVNGLNDEFLIISIALELVAVRIEYGFERFLLILFGGNQSRNLFSFIVQTFMESIKHLSIDFVLILFFLQFR